MYSVFQRYCSTDIWYNICLSLSLHKNWQTRWIVMLFPTIWDTGTSKHAFCSLLHFHQAVNVTLSMNPVSHLVNQPITVTVTKLMKIIKYQQRTEGLISICICKVILFENKLWVTLSLNSLLSTRPKSTQYQCLSPLNDGHKNLISFTSRSYPTLDV